MRAQSNQNQNVRGEEGAGDECRYYLWASRRRADRERESGRERGGDKPYESRKREAMRGMEWSGKGVEMLGSDSDMGVAEGSMPRFDSTVYQRYSFSSPLSLSSSDPLSLSPHVPRVLSQLRL